MVKKLMEDKRVALTDSLVKAAEWTHNMNVNKLGYTPMQLEWEYLVTCQAMNGQ